MSSGARFSCGNPLRAAALAAAVVRLVYTRLPGVMSTPAIVATRAAALVATFIFAVLAAGRDVGAGRALLEALIEADRRAGEIEGGAQAIFEEALIAEMQRLQLIREQDERGRRNGGLRNVEDLYFAIGWRSAPLEIDARKPAI